MVSEIDQYVIDKVRMLRQERGFSQSQLAFEMDMSTGFIAMIESGKYDKKYNISHLNKLAIILQCSPQILLPDKPLTQ
ncbi:transcriptional regulator [Flavipsychrobacter stenotrophus]|uniref:Transcriptional regulator n=1 Tax=Flavipsychrobacter stenotrophus TaxID=2077091 RepID=A0A2S7T1A5_9BACT|nr:helix-turn-helix transcriptional regulator [Flavipsychrobacter stenotrophus]PQJ12992.1 transcriptional regulator [Flavipsychrobacter stenotrophus]